MRRTLSALGFVLAIPALAETPSIDPQLAAKYFQQLEQTSARDGKGLWGIPICGPIFFVDRKTREVVANQGDAEGLLKPLDGVFVGSFPKEKNVANTAIDWAGVSWTMVLWPVPEWRQARERLLVHECFHRIQGSIGLPARDAVNSHLESRDGRIWLQLEWRALERALRQSGEARKHSIADALLFRAYRHSLFSDAAENESKLELNEGLAEYTGMKLSSETTEELAVRANQAIRDSRNAATLGRSFAYVSGPAIGALLDLRGKPWRTRVAAVGDLGRMLTAAYVIPYPHPDARRAEAAGSRYGAEEVIGFENRREEKRLRDVASAKRRFLEGPVLVLPLSPNVSYSYDPNNVFAIDATNTVYPILRLVDEWGILEVGDGAWLMRDSKGAFTRAQVEAPALLSARPLKGKGWSLELKEGWSVVAGERAGDFRVGKEAAAK